MSVAAKYSAAVEYLTRTAGDSVNGLGAGDERVNKLTEAGLCDAFERYVCGIAGDKGNAFFRIGEGDVLYVWDGRRYVRQQDPSVLDELAKCVMESAGVGLVYQKNSHAKIAQECWSRMRNGERNLLEPDRRWVLFRNCLLNMDTGEVREPGMDIVTDIFLDFDYIEGATSELWERIVSETIPDEGMRLAFRQFCGAVFLDREKYRIEKVCLLVGNGNDGKSLLAGTIASLLGSELVRSYSPDQLFRSQQSLYNMADINGRLLNYSDDVSNKDFSGGEFKQFVSGSRFMARFPYGRPFEVTRVPLMLMCVNDIPPTTDDTRGYYRRLLPIRCPNYVAPDQVDLTLPSRLRAEKELPGIFNWLRSGYLEVIAQGGQIKESESVTNMAESIKEDSNSVRRWVRESCFTRVTPTGRDDPRWRPFKDYMRMYAQYCRDFGEFQKSSKSVALVFRNCGFAMEKRRDTTWYCVGVLYEDEMPEAQSISAEVPLYQQIRDEDLPF